MTEPEKSTERYWEARWRDEHAENERLRFEHLAEITNLQDALVDVVDTLEAMGLHVDNPLYDRTRAALEALHQQQGGEK